MRNPSERPTSHESEVDDETAGADDSARGGLSWPLNSGVSLDSLAMPHAKAVDSAEFDAREFPLERYSPLALLGSGASGAVYLCYDQLLAKPVALKILRECSESQLISFQNEAKACSRVNHPHVVRVLDFGVTQSGVPYMVMEYINAISLDGLRLERGTIEWHQLVAIVLPLCDALAYLHAHNIFHRDLKPSNILVQAADSQSPRVWLIDFGVSMAVDASSSSGNMAGTPAYMSPDQSTGLEYTAASDIYIRSVA